MYLLSEAFFRFLYLIDITNICANIICLVATTLLTKVPFKAQVST